jgi:hypothetical protein
MGILDFFKRKDTSTPKTTQNSSTTDTSEVYKVVSKYNEYTKLFVNMMANGNYAPIAAYEKPTGEIVGYLYVTKDESYMLSVEQVIAAMKEEFGDRLHKNSINSYAIYYHSLFNNDNNHTIVDGELEPKAISIILKDKNNFSNTIAVPYTFEGEGFSIGPMTGVTNEEYKQILETALQEGKDYFQERIEREPKMIENEAGITIKTVNNGKVGDFWGGMLGFEFFRNSSPDMLMQYIALARTKNNPIKVAAAAAEVHELAFDRLTLRVIGTHKNIVSSFPTVQTSYAIEVEHRQIDEWEHSDNLEAIIHGKGRDTFAILYYATDYAFNREKYLQNKFHRVQLSAILYVLDIPSDEKEEGDVKFSDDFCMYMPSQEYAEFGCYDFVGILENIEKTTYLDNSEHRGYILKIRLINNEKVEDFFTIDMFVNEKNMRFSDLVLGMKLTGMFQLLGEIAE